MKNKSKNSFNKSLRANIITSLACLVMGIIMVAVPASVKTALSYVIGVVLLVYGVFNIISFFISKQKDLYIELIAGVISSAVGIFSLVSPNIIIDVIFIIIGILIIIDSLLDIKHAFALKSMNVKYWWIYFVLSIIVILLGIGTIIFKSAFQDMIMMVLGILLIYQGISGFSILFLTNRFSKKSSCKESDMINIDATDIQESN